LCALWVVCCLQDAFSLDPHEVQGTCFCPLGDVRQSYCCPQDAFSPDPHEVEEARQLVQAFEEHQLQGKGAFTFRDRMIDQPTYLQARNLLQFAARVGQA
jgi:hypothetical protein